MKLKIGEQHNCCRLQRQTLFNIWLQRLLTSATASRLQFFSVSWRVQSLDSKLSLYLDAISYQGLILAIWISMCCRPRGDREPAGDVECVVVQVVFDLQLFPSVFFQQSQDPSKFQIYVVYFDSLTQVCKRPRQRQH